MAASKYFKVTYTNNSVSTDIYDSRVHSLALAAINTNVKISGYVMKTGETTARSCVTVTGNGVCDTIEKDITGLDFTFPEITQLIGNASDAPDLIVAKHGYGFKMKKASL